MALVLKGGAIFLHVPKTGGNWVTAVLTECGLVERRLKTGHKHADVDRVLAKLGRDAAGRPRRSLGRVLGMRSHAAGNLPFMFCFVRHPVRWYESWFKYMSHPARNWKAWGDDPRRGGWHPNAMLDGLGADDFNTFVRNVIRRRPGYVTEMYGWYDRPGVCFIGKQENLCSDLIAVLSQLGLKFDEERIRGYKPIGVSQQPAAPIRWDPHLLSEVERLEYASLVRYNYQPLSASLRAA